MALMLNRPTTRLRLARPALLLASALLAAFGVLLGSARPAVACSCAMFESMKDYATVDNAVFTGTAGLRTERGVPVEVGQWLWGAGAAPIVWLADSSFSERSSCGTTPPAPGTSWIWVAWRADNGADFGTGLCSPAQRLDSPEGAAMLEEAVAVFGAATPPEPIPEPTDAAPAPSAAPDGTAVTRDSTALLVAGGVLIASLGLFGGLILFVRRQNRPAI